MIIDYLVKLIRKDLENQEQLFAILSGESILLKHEDARELGRLYQRNLHYRVGYPELIVDSYLNQISTQEGVYLVSNLENEEHDEFILGRCDAFPDPRPKSGEISEDDSG